MIINNKDSWITVLSKNDALTIRNSLIIIASFVVPFSIGHYQPITGTIINTALFLGAFYLPAPFIFAVVLLPSLAVLARGVIFGPLTPFLLILIPFIWFGNLLMVGAFKKLLNSKKGYLASTLIASLIKFTFLYFIIFFFSQIKIIPKYFLNTMALLQLPTAVAGGFASFLIKKFHA